jgi:hypothetical protein
MGMKPGILVSFPVGNPMRPLEAMADVVEGVIGRSVRRQG